MTCLTCLDVAWLLDSGETHPEVVARRLGIQRESLYVHLARHQRDDLRLRLDVLRNTSRGPARPDPQPTDRNRRKAHT